MSPRAKQILNGAVLLAGLAFCVVSLVRLQRDHPLQWSLDVRGIVLFAIFAIGALAAMATAWQRYVLAFFSVRLPMRHAAYQSCLMLVAKYVPIMIAGFVTRVSAYGPYASAKRVVFATLTELVGAVAAATVVGLTCLALAFVPAVVLIVVALAILAIWLAPWLVTKTLQIAARVRRSASPPQDIVLDPAAKRALREAPIAQIVQWIVLAGFVAISVRFVAPQLGAETLLVVSGAYALAVVAGIAVVFLPGGIGAREAAFVWLVSSKLGATEALQLALALRIAMSIFDLIAGAGCLLLRGAEKPTPR